MPVTLQNRRRQMQVFNLDHGVCCGPEGCGCTDLVATVIAEHPRTGELLPRHIRKKIPGSLTLLALETRRGLPDAILKVPDVSAAIVAGALRVVGETPKAAEPAATQPAAPALPAPGGAK